MANTKDPQNPYTVTMTNDLGHELTQLVLEWARSHRNVLNSAQQTSVITAITGILNGTYKF